MKLIVGLGNYPREYTNTRHNAGFFVVDEWLKKHNLELNKNDFNGWYCCFKNNNDEQIIVAKPYTYMNLSGQFVQPLSHFYKIPIDNILVICDDVDTAVGKIRVKKSGSSGGQNGLKNIIQLMGSENIKRVRIGIGRPTHGDMISHVIGKFTPNELVSMFSVSDQVCNLIDDFINDVPFEKIMSKYNK